jgi:carboxymethylenebutenolidase
MNTSLISNPEILGLFDQYVHGRINRRQFLDRVAGISVTGLSATAVLEMLSPDYARAQQVSPENESIEVGYRYYDSPAGGGEMKGYLAVPANAEQKLPGVVVIHENRGLNPYIEDVARRVAVAGFVAFAPDALTPLGGYPGNDDDGRTLQQQRDRDAMLNDFIAAVSFVQKLEACTGKVGCVGFCFGGWMANALAVHVADLAAAVPFYGGQPDAADVPKIEAPLLLHYAELDERVNAGWPAYRDALDKARKRYRQYTYANCNHGFHNDTTPRYDSAAAELAWHRTIEFFRQYLV